MHSIVPMGINTLSPAEMAVPGLHYGTPHNKGVSAMIEFPLILIGYACVPFIAIQLMVIADRPQQTGDQSTFPQVEIL